LTVIGISIAIASPFVNVVSSALATNLHHDSFTTLVKDHSSHDTQCMKLGLHMFFNFF
jgi:hypothetical protein